MTKTNGILLVCLVMNAALGSQSNDGNDKLTRVFIFAGQSNMVGSDSRVDDVKNFPPFVGLEAPQSQVLFSYCIGREAKKRSNGWVALQPVDNLVGPELSFARRVSKQIDAPIAIIKCAAGGTHLGGDWNPDKPTGFKMYPLALDLVKSSLAELKRQGMKYRIEGFMWHQGENDMFNEEYMQNYGPNLARFLASWRRDLGCPKLNFYIGELCTKTIWGMDLRPRMYAISEGQRFVTKSDPHARYVRTSHVGVEIGRPVGLHYHYGTLGQLQHGENYADAYLQTIGVARRETQSISPWPYPRHKLVTLFVLAGHRNMEGERAFVQDLRTHHRDLLAVDMRVAYKYNLGGGYQVSNSWEPFRAVSNYRTFGPELSFVNRVRKEFRGNLAIAKFTHSGSQINDWTPQGTLAKSRHLYPQFIDFVKESMEQIEQQGNQVECAGIFYHLGENEMSMPPYRKRAAEWLSRLVQQSRIDLEMADLKWFVSQQKPTDHSSVNSIDVVGDIAKLAASDENIIHIKAFQLPQQEKRIVLDSSGIIRLGEVIAETFLKRHSIAQDK